MAKKAVEQTHGCSVKVMEQVFALHLQLIKNASGWKRHTPALELSKVSHVRRCLLENGGPGPELGVGAMDKSALGQCGQCKINWNKVEARVSQALPYLYSIVDPNINEFLRLWQEFSKCFGSILVLGTQDSSVWDEFIRVCHSKNVLSLRQEKEKMLKQFIEEEVEYAETLRSRNKSMQYSLYADASDIVDMDIELLLYIASQKVERSDVVSIAVETDFASSNEEEDEQVPKKLTRTSSVRSTSSSGTARGTCGACDRFLSSRKSKSMVVECSYHECDKAFHLSCLKMKASDLPMPWFCQACVEPSLKSIGRPSVSRADAKSDDVVVDDDEKESVTSRSSSSITTRKSSRKLVRPSSPSSPPSASKPERKRKRETAAVSAARRAEKGPQVKKSKDTKSQKQEMPLEETRNQRKKSTSRSATTMKKTLQKRPSGTQSNVPDLVNAGYLKVGDKVEVPYLNKYRFVGTIQENGCIGFEGREFFTPPSFALYCKRKIYKDKQSDRGWTSCFHRNTPLLKYRQQLETQTL